MTDESDIKKQLEVAIKVIRGGIRVTNRVICSDDDCDNKHPRWEDCVMFRAWQQIANDVPGVK